MVKGYKPKTQKRALFQCMECGKKYYTTHEAEKRATACTRCNGNNIDLYVTGEFLFQKNPQHLEKGVRE